MRSASIAAAVSILVASAIAPGAAAADSVYRIILFEAQDMRAVLVGSVRRKGTGATARMVSAARYAADYTIQSVEYDCTWMKMRILAYDRYKPDGTLAQSYRDAEWTGAMDKRMRAYLCTGQGGVADVTSPSDHALGQAFLAGTLTLP